MNEHEIGGSKTTNEEAAKNSMTIQQQMASDAFHFGTAEMLKRSDDAVKKEVGYETLDIECCHTCRSFEYRVWDADHVFDCTYLSDVTPLGKCLKYENYPGGNS